MTHKSEKERLAQQIENDENIKQLLNERLEDQQKEFLANAVAVEMQSKLYEEVQQQLINIDPANGIEKAIKRVIQLIENRRNDHVDILFESYNKIKPGFLQKLKQHYPDLTQNDLKYIPLINENLDNTRISQTLNITVRGAEQRNHRLRKKLNLEKSANLKEFFDKFEDEMNVEL